MIANTRSVKLNLNRGRIRPMSGLSCALEPKIVAASFNEIHAGMELF